MCADLTSNLKGAQLTLNRNEAKKVWKKQQIAENTSEYHRKFNLSAYRFVVVCYITPVAGTSTSLID